MPRLFKNRPAAIALYAGFAWLSLALAAAAQVTAELAAVEPWAERAIFQHVDQSRYQGLLSKQELEALIGFGSTLFDAPFTALDGAGRPMATQAIIPTKRKRAAPDTFQRLAGLDANSCSSCHNEPVMGGAGDFTVNVFVSEGFNNADFDTSDPQFSNERNTNHLFGIGLVELLAREMSADLQKIRREALKTARRSGQDYRVLLVTKGIRFGWITAKPDGLLELKEIDGVDTDLVIRPFSQKGVMTSLRQFTVNALNHHTGMQSAERFGVRWTGEADFDEDAAVDELSEGDVSALVAWQAALPPPGTKIPDNAEWQEAAQSGARIFQSIGCASCHVPALPLDSLLFQDPGPLDAAGTLRSTDLENPAVYDLGLLDWAKSLVRNQQGQVLVPLFGDLKRHKMTDRQIAGFGNELLSQRFVERDVFQTTELWGIGSTAPYGHRGDMTTLNEVISAHGGAGRDARDAYLELEEADRSALIAYLKTLVIEP
uniref:di-heme oxidoredictase family protein n=1 Tax=Pararhizobium sp. IMCC3301 TaxID=3067904 RepID=UPI0027410A9C|nr:di-heme oxidoredictase family protein [Pararhizobium sp. IMCC3301]